jgi:hypothetical protein
MLNTGRIIIRTERAGDGLVKIVWGDSTGARFPPYRLYVKWLNDKALASRAALKAFHTAYLQPHPDFTQAIATLADHGYQLRRALFDDCPPEDRAAAAEPSLWFESLVRDPDSPIIISVHADPIMPIPWGLLHEFGSTQCNGDVYMGFWALRYQVAALYNGMAPRQLQIARPAGNVKLLSGLNQAVFESTREHLDAAQKDFIVNFLDRPVGRAFTSTGCRKRWNEVGDSDCVIHFFGHASGSELRFSDTDRLTASSFRNLFRRESHVVRPRTEPSYVLSFLNGCSSVSGDDANNFLVATADPGFCGFIGAEATVPDRFAMLFGQELLHSLLNEGIPVREAMSRLWRKHRPMALFYGCYAHPDFSISPAESCPVLPAGFDLCNFYPETDT